jgi:hypothetical protein
MSGTIALVAGVVAIIALALLIVIGYRAVYTTPTAETPKPHLEGRRVLLGVIFALIGGLATIVFVFAGVVWIVDRFTS